MHLFVATTQDYDVVSIDEVQEPRYSGEYVPNMDSAKGFWLSPIHTYIYLQNCSPGMSLVCSAWSSRRYYACKLRRRCSSEGFKKAMHLSVATAHDHNVVSIVEVHTPRYSDKYVPNTDRATRTFIFKTEVTK